ncbi:cytochrome P450 [Phascolomyces articulosus]|uniref:Cytochrome P450 n=1 Tax=Phascolomyces articulosus TaxID=60185 RepID=A0AAD5JS51_9FUNG|nr:cytochrome P450 [Phascolomyces articulosus]
MPLVSSLMLPLNNAKEQFWNLWLRILNNNLVKSPANRKKTAIPIAVVLASIYFVYRKLILPPPQLHHIPRAGFFQYVTSLFKGRPYDEILKEITDHGLYTAFGSSGWTVYVTRPESAKKLLLKTDLFPKAIMSKAKKETIAGKFLMGPNIIFLPHGPQWKGQRSILNPAFHRSMPIRLFGELAQKLFVEIDKKTDSPIDAFDTMTRWTLDAIGIAGFDFDFNAIQEKDSVWVVRYEKITNASVNPVFMLFPFLDSPYLRFLFPRRARIHHELDLFLDKMQEIITHKRAVLANSNGETTVNKVTNEKDLLTLMLEAAEEESGNKMSDEEIKSNLCGFFIAGHDTTAIALSYAMYNLATHPEVQKKAREEVIKVLGDKPMDVLPTIEQIKEMPYIQMIIKETLRRNTVAQNIVTRAVPEDTDLDGCVIPKGTRVTMDMMGLHRNPKIWKNPDEFDPERFAPGGEAEMAAKKNGMAWMPFSNGARMCIGVNFSLNEQRVFLPMLLRKYELSLPDNSPHKEKPVISGIGLQKPVNLQINFKRRY